MSADPGYMLIRVELQGAQKAAAEAAGLGSAITGVGEASVASSTAATTAASSSARSTSRMNKYWSTAGKVAKLGALGIAGAAAGIAYAGVHAADKMKELGLVAAGLRRNLGLAADEGSRWAAVAEARGIAPTSLNMGFKTLAQNLTMANKEGGTYMDNLQLIGITHDEVAKGTKNFDWFIQDVAKHFGDMEGGAKRQTAAAKLLGRGYQTLLPLFADGNKSLQEQLGWADKYHVAMGDKMVNDTLDLANAQRESKIAWLGIEHELGRVFMPMLLDAHDQFQDFAQVITDPHLSEDEKIHYVSDKLKELAGKLSQLINDILPGLVSQMANNAPRVALAFINGFISANGWGRLVAGLWLASKLAPMFGTKGIFAKLGGTGGRMFAVGMITLGMVEFGPMIFDWAKEQGEKFKGIFYDWGYKAGMILVNAINKAITLINDVLDKANILGKFGVDAPNIGLITPGAYQPPGTVDDQGNITPQGAAGITGGTSTGADPTTGIGPVYYPPGFSPTPTGGGHGGKRGDKRPSTEMPRSRTLPEVPDDYWTSSSDVILDGEKIGKVIHKHATKKMARK